MPAFAEKCPIFPVFSIGANTDSCGLARPACAARAYGLHRPWKHWLRRAEISPHL